MIIEPIYKICFFVNKLHRKHITKKTESFPFKVISLGNISVGGTGKSVLTRFIISCISQFSGAVVSRGYKSLAEKYSKSLLVSDGKKIFLSVQEVGDEPIMLAKFLEVPVVVGRDRAQSCRLLAEFNSQKTIDYVVLDDAYQNYRVRKDFEILLLDARSPFSNSHCLPAGRLRENDISRADCIIFTHADLISSQSREDIVKNFSLKTDKPIFFGKHKLLNLSDFNGNNVDIEFFKDRILVPFAGLGSFSQFLEKLTELGLFIKNPLEYPDHYHYSIKDVCYMLKILEQNKAYGFITTYKDINKILALNLDNTVLNKFFLADVEFNFLTNEEHINFIETVREVLKS